MNKVCYTLFLLIVVPSNLWAQEGLVEIRVSSTEYRYFDIFYSTQSGWAVDAFYIGVPDSDEINLGLGHDFLVKGLVLTPALYIVRDVSAGTTALKLGLIFNMDRDGWKIVGFLAHNAPLEKEGLVYQVLDPLDLTHSLGRWDLGASIGFFRHRDSDGKRHWNLQAGPVIKLNDKDSRGAWAFSARYGPEISPEYRITRLWIF